MMMTICADPAIAESANVAMFNEVNQRAPEQLDGFMDQERFAREYVGRRSGFAHSLRLFGGFP